MLKNTIWHPDTCECVIEYFWDDSLSEDDRVHQDHSFLHRCDAHSILSDQECLDAINLENRTKNVAMQVVADLSDDHSILQVGDQSVPKYIERALIGLGVDTSTLASPGEQVRRIPDTSAIMFSFDEKRNLILSAPGISPDSAKAATDQVNADSSVGSVTIEE